MPMDFSIGQRWRHPETGEVWTITEVLANVSQFRYRKDGDDETYQADIKELETSERLPDDEGDGTMQR